MRVFFLMSMALSFPFAVVAENSDVVTQLLSTRQCVGCDLQNVDLQGRDLQGVDLSNADLRDANLTDASMIGANLEGANLVGVDLYSTDITGANLRGADLSHLDADRDLEFIVLIGVQLEGAKFKQGIVCGPPSRKGGFGCEHQ